MPPLLAFTQPRLLPPPTLHHLHRHRHRNNTNTKPLIISSSDKKRFHFAATRIVAPRRILLPSTSKSASINGVSVQNNPEASAGEVNAAEFLQRIRKLVAFLPSIFAGGSWWNFSDDVEVPTLAQPVTVWRALGKMWELVARDRWVIITAFSTLVIAAVRAILFFFPLLVYLLADFFFLGFSWCPIGVFRR